jgi:Uncharacterized conserved protein
MSKTPCIPDAIPPENLDWRRLLPEIGRANAALARYDGMLQTLRDPAILLSPLTVNEAVLTSRIEGTQATLDEVLQHDAGLQLDSEKARGDFEEISKYRAAVRIAEDGLTDRPLSLSMIKSAHQRLMQGVRGRDKRPGDFRREQNFIGRRGDTIDRARFVPPSPLVMQSALKHWEDYLQNEMDDPVLQVALAHAQFEIIHPFMDGNGRMGRMLIPLLFYKRRVLTRPVFYLSEFLERNRDQYYDRLLAITDQGDWQSWVVFFCRAVIAQADVNIGKVRAIHDLYEETKQRAVDITHSQFAVAAVDTLFTKPVIQAPDFAARAGFNNRVTANNMLRAFETAGLVERLRDGSGRKPAVFALRELINITEGRSVFR